MSIQFDEIGQTIAIGAFFLISTILLLRHRADFQELFKQLNDLKLPQLFVTAVLLAFLYSIGVLAQSISKNTIADRQPNANWFIPSIILPDDEYMRDASFKYYKKRWTPADERIFGEAFDNIGQISSINSLFFHCKNIIFNDPRFYPELKSIENKMSFSAALTLISWFSLIIYMFALISRLIQKKGSEEIFLTKFRYEFYYSLILFLLLVAGSFSYRSQQDNFNLRIYGYYSAQKIMTQLTPHK